MAIGGEKKKKSERGITSCNTEAHVPSGRTLQYSALSYAEDAAETRTSPFS